MVLTAVQQSQAIGIAGQRMGIWPQKVESLTNNAENTAKVVDAAFTPQNSTAYTLLINGVTITVTSDASGTAAEVRDLFIAAIAANAFTNAVVTAAASGANLRITERTPANGEIAITESDANIALTVVTAHGHEQPMPAGIAVARGPDPTEGLLGTCRLLTSGEDVVGVTLYSQAIGDSTLDGTALYAAGSVIPVLRSGRLLVKVEEAVTPASAVFVRHTASGANTQLGAFRTDADGGSAVALAAAEYMGVASAGGLVELEINLP